MWSTLLILLRQRRGFLVSTNQEIVSTFKSVVPFSRYTYDTLLLQRLSILNTKKWGALMVSPITISWPYTKYSVGSTTKKVKDSAPALMGVLHSALSGRKVKTLAQESSLPLTETPSSPDVLLLEEITAAHSSPLSTQDSESAWHFVPYVGPPFDLRV